MANKIYEYYVTTKVRARVLVRASDQDSARSRLDELMQSGAGVKVDTGYVTQEPGYDAEFSRELKQVKNTGYINE
jgi:hypothetical protein